MRCEPPRSSVTGTGQNRGVRSGAERVDWRTALPPRAAVAHRMARNRLGAAAGDPAVARRSITVPNPDLMGPGNGRSRHGRRDCGRRPPRTPRRSSGCNLGVVDRRVHDLGGALVRMVNAPLVGCAEAERMLVYVGVAAAIVSLIGSAGVGWVLAIVTGIITAVCVVSLADRHSGDRLVGTVGYLERARAAGRDGSRLCVGWRRPGQAPRLAATAGLVPTAATVYLTYSRGALIAVAVGVIGIAVARRDWTRSPVRGAIVACASGMVGGG